MTDPFLAIIVVGLAISVALGSALLFRGFERRRVEREPLDLSPLRSAVTLFSDAGCARCDEARDALVAAGADFEEIRFDHHREVVESVGVTGVPMIVARGPDGRELGRIVGRPSPRQLHRLLAKVE